jgi:protein tyrosine phosphatase
MTTGIKEKGKVKCAPYFPQSDKVGKHMMKYGSFTITCTKKTVFGTYTHAVFKLERGENKKTVDHFWFTAWPDHGAVLFCSWPWILPC